ncbi:MAG: hypothetical protein Q9214_000049 [Letrouitia sp. 1 TL-2023]
MSRQIYLMELQRDARQRAREARLANLPPGPTSDDNNSELSQRLGQWQDDLMELVEQGKAAIGRVVVSLIPIAISASRDGPPHGTANLGSALTSAQPYHVSLFLHLPRTPNNLAAGNFMLDLSLLSSAKISPTAVTSPLSSKKALAKARRPAILTYASPIIDTASTITGLPWYVIGWKTESEVLQIPMFEGVEFAKGAQNIPQEAMVVVEADQKMQFYEVGIRVIAKFGGLRWIMYHHRIISYLVFTSMFWTCAMLTSLLVWLILSTTLSPRPQQDRQPIKEQEAEHAEVKSEQEELKEPTTPSLTEELSDTSRTFPTLGRHMPLHFPGRGRSRVKEGERDEEEDKIKREDEDVMESAGIQPLNGEADDEDEERETAGQSFRDSGIGTSIDEGRTQREEAYEAEVEDEEEPGDHGGPGED